MSDKHNRFFQAADERLGTSRQRSCSLAVLVECVVSPLLREHPTPILFELNVPIDLVTTTDQAKLADVVRSLVKSSLEQMTEGGELTVTGCQTSHGVELEIADTGGDLDSRGHKFSIAVAALGCKPQWQSCPQGGVAVTLTLPFQDSVRKAA
jgi:hypothetical protein